MTHAWDVRQRVERAGCVAEALDAAYDAFEAMLSLIGGYQDGGGPFYAALVMAATVAADGRDMMAAASSMPSAFNVGRTPARALARTQPVEVAAIVATLSGSVADRLRVAATTAEAAGDRLACVQGARYAGEVHALITGTWP